MASETPSPGTVLASKYRVDRVLGAGGMAVVVAATHVQLREPVAIKILHRQVLSRAGAFERFLREARVAMRLKSEHVARVFDVGALDDGTPFIVMELLRGADFAALLAERGRFEVAEAVDCLLQACQAIAEAHLAGVVHRDLKPANLFLCTSVDGLPLVKVLDFGVSKLLAGEAGTDVLAATMPAEGAAAPPPPSGPLGTVTLDPVSSAEPSVTLTRAFLGSPQYMAPEQIRSARDVDVRADIWALGVILYELVGGRRPFGGDTLDALCASILERAPAPLDVAGEGAPELDAVLKQAMAKDPAARLPSVRAFAEAIVPFASEDGRASYERVARLTSGETRSRRSSAPPPPVARDSTGGSRSSASRGGRRGRRASRWAAGALAAIVGVAAVPLVMRGRLGSHAVPDAAPTAARCSVAACTASNGGAPSRCREDGACVALASEDCQVLADTSALAGEDTVWFGAMLPPSLEPDLHAIDLARTDFVQMMAGYARTGGETHARPMGVVACDDSKDPMRAARHLVDVGVPAVLGFGSAAEVVDVCSSLLIPSGVLAVVTESTSPLVTALPMPSGRRLVWRTTFTSEETVKVIARFLEDVLEPGLRSARGAAVSGEPLRVANFRTKMRGGPKFDEMLFDSIRFNGKSALENGEAYRQIVLDDGASEAEVATRAAAAVESLEGFAPHVVVLSGSEASFDKVVVPLERRWSKPGPRPTYVIISGIGPSVLRWIGRSAERRRRVFGIEPLSNTSVNARFVMHYNENEPERVTARFAPNSSYDAFYLVAYATVALGSQRVTGDGIAGTIPRLLPPGRPVDVGPSGIFDAFSTLRGGANIDLNGATGSLDFDPSTGEARFDHAVLCVGTGADGLANDSVESGAIYRSALNRMEGAVRCP